MSHSFAMTRPGITLASGMCLTVDLALFGDAELALAGGSVGGLLPTRQVAAMLFDTASGGGLAPTSDARSFVVACPLQAA
jgi:hypothetical protein